VSVLLLAVACTQPGATAVPATTLPTPLATAAATLEPTAEATAEVTAEATSEATAEATPEVTPEATLEPTPQATADACAPETIATMLKNPGRLTLSTDLPAFPPWFGGDVTEQYPNEPEGGDAWTNDAGFGGDPYSGEGFEGATAYAVAAAMGFDPEQVDWIPNTVFEQAFAPGVKAFDFHMAQIAITDERAEAVTFSDPYFESNQSLLALSSNDIVSAASIEDLKAFKLGAAANTTSLAFIESGIAPDVEPSIFNDNAAAQQALQSGTVDGIVVDLSTAFYMRDAEIDDFDTPEPEGTIVGQFGPPAEPDRVGFVLELESPLVACLNQAIAQIQADGTSEAILDEWINTGEEIPFLE
jgi:polar amino acid transport system substrate-binding protein